MTFFGIGSARVRSVLQALASNALSLVLGFVGSIVAARLLGPGGRGQLAAVVTWTAIASALADLGISQSCSYYGAKSRSQESVVAGTALAMGVVISTVLVCSFIPFRRSLFGAVLPGLSWLYLFTIPLGFIATYLAAILQGMNQMSAFNQIRTIQASAYAVALLIVWSLKWANVELVLITVFVCQLLSTLTGVAIASQHLPLSSWRLHTATAHKLLAYGMRTYAGNLFWLANGRLDQALLSLYSPMRELGFYAVAVSYSGILFGLSGALAMVMFPRIAGSPTAEGRHRELWLALRGLAMLSIPLACFMAGAARWVIPTVYGPAFTNSIAPAFILLVGGALLGINYILSNGLRASGRPGAPAFAEAAGLIVTVAGLPVVLPRWGITGAAWVSVLSYGLTTVILTLLWRRNEVIQ
jgi:O-antigen/teichoic acid export membrane protein